jgi:hypothetical protein
MPTGLYNTFTAVTEDFTRVNGIIAGCGQAALLTILHITKGLPATSDELKAIIVQGINGHQAGVGGESTPSNLIWLAQQYGQIIQTIDFNRLDDYVGQQPIIVGVSNASAFGGSDVGVHGHYITILDKSGRNYVVSDPNTVASQQGNFILYSPGQLAAAQPFWTAIVPLNNGTQTSMLSDTPGTVVQPNPLGLQFSNPFDTLKPVGDFFSQLNKLAEWLGNPLRLLKMLVGIALIVTALLVGFLEKAQENSGAIVNILGAAEGV